MVESLTEKVGVNPRNSEDSPSVAKQVFGLCYGSARLLGSVIYEYVKHVVAHIEARDHKHLIDHGWRGGVFMIDYDR